MTSTTVRPARNGVDVPTLFATLDAVAAQPELAQFQFRARNTWLERHAQPHRRSMASTAPGGGHQPYRAVHLRRRPPGRPGRRPATVRRRSSSCCTRSPRA